MWCCNKALLQHHLNICVVCNCKCFNKALARQPEYMCGVVIKHLQDNLNIQCGVVIKHLQDNLNIQCCLVIKLYLQDNLNICVVL